MKTLTEFSSAVLKTALKAKQELTTAGKTAEELPAALGEVLKLEGEKLTFVLAATELVEKKLEDLKRVVVMKLNEGEKAPGGTIQKGEHCFSAEYYPSLNPPKAARGADRNPRDKGRGGRGDKKGGKRGRGDSRGPGRDSRGPGRPVPAQADGAAASTEARPARPPRQRPPRAPRPEVPAGPPKPPGWVVKPKSDTPDSTQAPAPSTPAATENSGTEKV